MIALYIIGGILLLLVIVALIPVKVFFTTDDGKHLLIRVLCFKWGILPIEEKKPSEKAKAKAESHPKKLIGKNGTFNNIGELLALIKVLLRKVFWIAKKIRINKMEALITIGEADAAETAIQYGKACALVYPAFGMLGSFTDISNAKVEVISDFDSGESDLSFEAEISARVFYVFIAAVSVLWQLVKIKLSAMGSNNNERKK